ncbi:MAG TPA: SET domain-containing protein, partial [Rhizobacter sp.]|nr:SET domain-containing protein [Rhizobacter sp.]
MPRLTELPPPVATVPAVPARRGPQHYAVEVQPSAIDGQGAFAAEAIPARRKIGEVRGEAVSAQEAQRRSRGQARIMMIAVSPRRAVDASQSTDALRFAN